MRCGRRRAYNVVGAVCCKRASKMPMHAAANTTYRCSVDSQTLAASRRNGAATIIVMSGVSVCVGVPNDIAYECFELCSIRCLYT